MSDFTSWLKQRESDAKAAGAIHVHQAAQPTIQSDFAVPMLQAAGIGFVVIVAALGLALICGAAWRMAWRWALGLGLGAWAVALVAFVLEHRFVYRAPVQTERDKVRILLGEYGAPMPESEDVWRVIRPRSKPIALPATVDHTVQAIEPDARPEIQALYNFIVKVWARGNVSRRAVMDLGFSRSQWERYVGGRRGQAGQESGRGLLDRAGCVQMTPNGWETCASLQDALSFNDELRAYAEAKAQMVRLGERDGRDGMGRDNPGRDSRPSRPE